MTSSFFKQKTLAGFVCVAFAGLFVSLMPNPVLAQTNAPFFTMFANIVGSSGAANNAFTGMGGVREANSAASDYASFFGNVGGSATPGGGLCGGNDCGGSNFANFGGSFGGYANGWASHSVQGNQAGDPVNASAGSSSIVGGFLDAAAGIKFTPLSLD